MHLVIVEFALVGATVRPLVLSRALHYVFDESTLVARHVKHDELALTVAETI